MSDDSIFSAQHESLATDKAPNGIHTLKVLAVPAPASAVGSATPSSTFVTASVTSKQVYAASTTRKGMVLYGIPGAIFYGRWGATAATTVAGGYDFRLFGDDEARIPDFMLGQALQGIWSAAVGGVQVVEGT